MVLAGVLCVLDESRFSGLRSWPLPTHTLFATLLCGWLLAEWYTSTHKSDAAAGDARDFTRDLTLRMYLMLYVIVGVGQLISLFSLHYGGTFHHPDGSFLIIALLGLALARVPRFLEAFLISKRGG